MPTPAEEAFAEGFAALAEVHDPDASWTFGEASFAGVMAALKPDDPRMSGSGDRLFELEVSTASLPSPPPARGDELARGSKTYRIARLPDDEPATGLTRFVLALA